MADNCDYCSESDEADFEDASPDKPSDVYDRDSYEREHVLRERRPSITRRLDSCLNTSESDVSQQTCVKVRSLSNDFNSNSPRNINTSSMESQQRDTCNALMVLAEAAYQTGAEINPYQRLVEGINLETTALLDTSHPSVTFPNLSITKHCVTTENYPNYTTVDTDQRRFSKGNVPSSFGNGDNQRCNPPKTPAEMRRRGIDTRLLRDNFGQLKITDAKDNHHHRENMFKIQHFKNDVPNSYQNALHKPTEYNNTWNFSNSSQLSQNQTGHPHGQKCSPPMCRAEQYVSPSNHNLNQSQIYEHPHDQRRYAQQQPEENCPFNPTSYTSNADNLSNRYYKMSANDHIVPTDINDDSKNNFKSGNLSSKLPPYDGVTEPLETFLARFENFSSYFCWNEGDRLFHLKNTLTGSVGTILWDNGFPIKNSSDLIRILKSRYGSDHQMERFRMELKVRRRRKGESLQNVYLDIKRLLALAYPGETGSVIESMGVDVFVNAFADKELRRQVLQRGCTTLDEALSWAIRMEAIDSSANIDEPIIFNSDGNRKDRAYARMVDNTDNSQQIEKLSRQVKHYQDELANRRSWDAYQNTEYSSQLPLQNSDQNNQYGDGNRYSTQSLQQPYKPHNTRHNPITSNTQYGNAVTNTTKSQIVCFGCGGHGHLKRNCSFYHEQQHGNNTHKYNNPAIQSSFSPEYQYSRHGPARANGVTWGKSVPETYMEINFSGQKFNCLLDTGCDFSLIPKRLVPNAKLTPIDMEVFAANGTKISILGCMKMNFTVQGLPIEADLLVSEDIHEFMLGYDWLTEQQAIWLFSEAKLIIDGHEIPLKVRKSSAHVSRVYVRDVFTIPSNTECNVPVKLVKSSIRVPLSDWLVEPRTISNGIYVARSLLPNDDTYAAIRVMNISDNNVTLRSGLEISRANMATVITGYQPTNTSSRASALQTKSDITNMDDEIVTTSPMKFQDNLENCHSQKCANSSSQSVSCTTVPTRFLNEEHLRPIFDCLPASLSYLERNDAIAFIREHQSVFSSSEYDLGRTTLVTHHINTGTALPIRQGLRRHPQTYLNVIDQEIDKMLTAGVIEPASSPWASNVVVVTKHDKTARITLDYRHLNNITYRDSYPLPNVQDCLDAFKGSSYFAILDLRSSFYQVPLAEEDRDKTAFITRRGQFRFRSLPMGLSNAPSCFQRLMDLVMRGLSWKSVLVYIDDIVVYGKSFEELKERLREVFSRLKIANLKLKPSKVRLFQREIPFLGHKISHEGVAMDVDKVSEILTWPVPRDVHQTRQFLGLAGYFRRFIKNYSVIAGPLHELTKKNEVFVWNSCRQVAFDSLKQHLTSAPVLAMSQDVGEFVLDVDASDTGAGAVLQQVQDGKLRVISYASKIFNTCEKKYCITKKELAAIVFGLKHFRQYLLGRKFVIRSDHSALQYLQTAKELIGQQARWLDLIEEFDFTIQHRAGSSHQNADALSRKLSCEDKGLPCKHCMKLLNSDSIHQNTEQKRAWLDTSEATINANAVHTRHQTRNETLLRVVDETSRPRETPLVETPRPSLRKRRKIKKLIEIKKTVEVWTNDFLKIKQDEDRDLVCVREWLKEGIRPSWQDMRGKSPAAKAYWQQFESLVLKDGVIKRCLEGTRYSESREQLLLPNALREELLKAVHCGIAGHMGMVKTCFHISQRAYWFQWRRDVEIFCKKCDRCNEFYRGKIPPKQGLLQPMVLGSPFERLSVDLAGPFPKSSNGYSYILTAICAFSKFTILVPISDKCAITVARAIWNNVFLKFGAPSEILTDNGGEFRNQLLSELCRLIGVARCYTTAYQARTNGVCERNHATINSMLAKCISSNQRDWDSHLQSVAFFYNASTHEATQFTPFFLVFGTQPRWDIDFQLGCATKEKYSANDFANVLVNRMETAHELARENLHTAALRMKDWHNRKVHTQFFNPGDEVYVLNLRLPQGKCVKWTRRYSDLANIVKRINNVTYLVHCPQWRERERILHVDKLKLRNRSVQGEQLVQTTSQ
jgi:hypothetical protein